MRLQKKEMLFLISLFLLGSLIFILNFDNVDAQAATVCAEKTLGGAWCQNVPQSQADTRYRTNPTSCEATSYCKLGTCVNGIEGSCMPNVPQRVCQENNGIWVEGSPQTISQCRLGCCYIGDGTSFITQTRCSNLASVYGLEVNFRGDIRTELECVATASPKARGACVFDDGFTKNCRVMTGAECQNEELSTSTVDVSFHEGFLCSAEVLATICGPSQKTTLVQDKDEVYFVDTCGNVANIYDSSKVNNQEYWTNIKSKSESCNPDSSNVNSATCGNCNYLLGSTAKRYESGNPQTPTKSTYGDFVCADLGCTYEGQKYQHGEEWCGSSLGISQNLPGSEYHKLSCYAGEVTSVMCDSFRQTTCIQGEVNSFKTAACRANLWQDCILQDNKQDCENTDKRDCRWIEGQSVLRDDKGNFLILNDQGELVQGSKGEKGATCLPKNTPGFDFWIPTDEGGQAEEICAIASDNCVVKFTKGLVGSWECEENCHCLGLRKGDHPGDYKLDNIWLDQRNKMCIALGDCGSSTNYRGIQGYFSKTDLIERITKVGD